MTAAVSASEFRLTVLNPGGRDPEQSFADGVGEPGVAHPPVNFHGYAACTLGFFDRDIRRAVSRETPVLLLLRGDFTQSERALRELQKVDRTVAVSLKETGLNQIAQQLGTPDKLARFIRIVQAANGCIASTPEAAELYRQLRPDDTVAFIPTPYPVDDANWNFARPLSERSGIFIGTREFDVPSRNHLTALLVARRLSEVTGERVTVFNFDGRRGRKLIRNMHFAANKLQVFEAKLSYARYLELIAKHRLIFQLDRSRVPGQVAGDSFLAGVVCVGGDGSIDRLVFPHTCGFNRSFSEVGDIANVLLTDTERYSHSIEHSRANAHKVSLQTVHATLHSFFSNLVSQSN